MAYPFPRSLFKVSRYRPIQCLFISFLLLQILLVSTITAAAVIHNDVENTTQTTVKFVPFGTNESSSTVATTHATTNPIEYINNNADVSAVATTVNFTVTAKVASATEPTVRENVAVIAETTPKYAENIVSVDSDKEIDTKKVETKPLPNSASKNEGDSDAMKNLIEKLKDGKHVVNDSENKTLSSSSAIRELASTSEPTTASSTDAPSQPTTTTEYATTPTEDYHFDVNDYTSEYKYSTYGSIPPFWSSPSSSSSSSFSSPQNESTSSSELHSHIIPSNDIQAETQNHNQTVSIPTPSSSSPFAHFASISDNQIGNFSHHDYEHKFDQIVLTTPETLYFDKIHKQFEQDKHFQPEIDDDYDRHHPHNAHQFNVTVDQEGTERYGNILDGITANQTTEKNSSRYYNNFEVESTNYDSSANEIHNGTTFPVSDVANGTSEKRGKFLQDNSNAVNLTIPNTADVWALASMKTVEHNKIRDGQFYNITSVKRDPQENTDGQLSAKKPSNNTMVTKQLADWVEVMKHNDFSNNSYGSDANASVPLLHELHSITKNNSSKADLTQDNASQENQIVSVRLTTASPPMPVLKPRSNSTKIIEDSADKSHIVPLEKSDNSIPKDDNSTDSRGDIDENIATTLPTDNEISTNTIATDQNGNSISKNEHNFFEENSTDEIQHFKNHDHDDGGDDDESLTTVSHDDIIPTTVYEEDSTHYDDTEHLDKMHYLESTTPDVPITTRIPVIMPFKPSVGTLEPTNDVTTTDLPSTTKPDESIESNLIVRTSESNSKTETPTTISTPATTPSTNNKDEIDFTTLVIDLDNNNHEEWGVITTTESAVIGKPEVHSNPDTNENEIDGDENRSGHLIPLENATHDYPTVGLGEIGGFSTSTDEPDVNAIIAISVSVVGVICLILLVGFLVVMRKRQKQLTYAQRCRPVGMDAYSLDNVSVYNSVRRKGVLRQSKRAYGNAAFDDPSLKNNLLNIMALATYVTKKHDIYEEFKELPTVTARVDEVPVGCEDKNRYANVVPLPETRVYLKRINNDDKSEYINANFVKGPKDTSPYYIACQAPLDHTVTDFWRMIWEQNSRVIIMATDLTENGIEKCAEYLPPSVVLDNHVVFGDFQITLKSRDVKDKYAVSMIHLKNVETNTWREVTHLWYQWPDTGAPTDEATMVAMLLESRSYLKMALPDQMGNEEDAISGTSDGQDTCSTNSKMENGNIDKLKSLPRFQGPLTVHCSPGTGRTGTIIACDIAIRALEQPTRSIDIPQIVYFVRSGRASAVRTREQYEFIYKVAHIYATKLTGPTNEN